MVDVVRWSPVGTYLGGRSARARANLGLSGDPNYANELAVLLVVFYLQLIQKDDRLTLVWLEVILIYWHFIGHC
jgi:hypothetical protein